MPDDWFLNYNTEDLYTDLDWDSVEFDEEDLILDDDQEIDFYDY